MKIALSACIFLIGSFVFAEKASLKVGEIDTASDTTISIKKGVVNDQCIQYEIISGEETISGNPEYERAKALASWKAACDEWKQSMKEMNKDNRLISLNCKTSKQSKEDERFVYTSTGIYKVRVLISDKK